MSLTEPVATETQKFGNIAEYLSAQARRSPASPAVIMQASKEQISYHELDQRSWQLAQGLQRIGITAGTRTVIMLPPGIDCFVCVFALFKAGAILVVADPGLGMRNFATAIRQAEPQAFIGTVTAHLLRRLGNWNNGRHTQNVLSGKFPLPGHTPLQTLFAEIETPGRLRCEIAPAGNAAILFTSGSTGPPKGVLYTHENFISQIKHLQSIYQIQPGEVDLATFPLFALFAPALGTSAVIPDMNVTRPGKACPHKLLAAIKTYHATSMFGSPALLRQLVKPHQSLPGMQRIISAGAPVSAKIIHKLTTLVADETMIYTPYGATEALPVSNADGRALLAKQMDRLSATGAGVCVGKVVADTEVHIIRISDEVIAEWSNELLLPAGEIGEIVVRGRQVTAQYYGQQQATRQAKIACVDGGFFHRMGDLGYFDAQGLLWFCGRKSQRVCLSGQTLYTTNCEEVFNAHPQVERSALVGISWQQQTVPVICIQPQGRTSAAAWRQLQKELQGLAHTCEQTRRIEYFLLHAQFPVDVRHNAKINREKLAQWAQRKWRCKS